MKIHKPAKILLEPDEISSGILGRKVIVDYYLPTGVAHPEDMSLLLINDGQDMERMRFQDILEDLCGNDQIRPVLCVGIHAGADRKLEYGTAGEPDYKGRGSLARHYADFIFQTLLPRVRARFGVRDFKEKAFAGFSLGGLSALDIVWNHPAEFSKTGVFSGSLWWRRKDQSDPAYDDYLDRIMHLQIRKGNHYPWLKFFFQCGTDDEREDRNGNGVIDSIDDTLDLMAELEAKGYSGAQLQYLLIQEGRHDVDTWAKAMPQFLRWGWAWQEPGLSQ